MIGKPGQVRLVIEALTSSGPINQHPLLSVRPRAEGGALLKPGGPAIIARPGPDALGFSRAMVSAFGETGLARSPEAAADVLRNAVTKLRG
jgi:hypothetical protein